MPTPVAHILRTLPRFRHAQATAAVVPWVPGRVFWVGGIGQLPNPVWLPGATDAGASSARRRSAPRSPSSPTSSNVIVWVMKQRSDLGTPFGGVAEWTYGNLLALTVMTTDGVIGTGSRISNGTDAFYSSIGYVCDGTHAETCFTKEFA
jgi:hypothetical protein